MKRFFIAFMISICMSATFYSCTESVYASDVKQTQKKVDTETETLVKTIGYFIILIFAIKDILLEMQKGDVKGVGSVFIRYMLIYAALLSLPIALKWVETFVEGLRG